jgi:hypothetical protein
MQIALVAVVLLAGMWFTVLKPKPATDGGAPVAAQPTAPGAAGLGRAVNAAKGASAASDAANASIQKATGGTAASTAAPAAAAKPTATKATATKAAAKPATTKAVAKPAKVVAKKPAAAPKTAAPKAASASDPSAVLLSYLAKGKTVVLLFHGDGADDVAARKAVHRVALHDKGVVSAYASISKVAKYDAITSGIDVTSAPTILVIGKNKKAVELTGFVDYGVVRQTIGDVRAAAGQRR